MKLVRNISFGAVMLLYLWFPYSMIIDQQHILKNGEVFRFRPQPVDPYDAFRGRYITLQFVEQTMDFPNAYETFLRNDQIYVMLEKDSLGYYNFSDPTIEKPSDQNYIKTNVLYTTDNRVTVKIPENLSRYYLNEKLAPLAEKKYRELTRNTESDEVNVYLDARVLNGEVLIEELYFEDKPVSEYLKSQ